MNTNTQPIGFDHLSMNVMMMIMRLIMMMMMVGWGGEFHAMHTNRHRIGLDGRN